MNDKARALLDAHVTFVIAQLTGDQFGRLVEEHVDAVLADMGRLTLGEMVTVDQVLETARFYASEMAIAPGIPELVGDISRELYNHPGHDDTRIGDLISEKRFREFSSKIAEMSELRQRFVHEAVNNPVYAEMIGDVLYHGIKNYLADNPITKRIPGASSMMKLGRSVMDMTNVEEGLKKYINHNIKASLRESERFLLKHLTDRALRELLEDAWSKIRDRRVAEFRNYVAEEDVEDAFVIGFEYWRELRESAYYQGLVDAGVRFFFGKYQDSTLLEVLEEVGVSRDMIVRDIMHYAPRVLGTLQEKKMLDPIVRRVLQPFYESEAAQALLG